MYFKNLSLYITLYIRMLTIVFLLRVCLSVTAGVLDLEMEATSALPATKAICVALQIMPVTHSCSTDNKKHILRFFITYISMLLNQMYFIILSLS